MWPAALRLPPCCLLQVFVHSGGGPVAGDFVSELRVRPSAAAVRVLSPELPNPGALQPGEPPIPAPVLVARPAASDSLAQGTALGSEAGLSDNKEARLSGPTLSKPVDAWLQAGNRFAFDPAKLRADVDALAAAARAQPARWRRAHIGSGAGPGVGPATGSGRGAAAGHGARGEPDPTATRQHQGMDPDFDPGVSDPGSGEGARGERRKRALDELRALDARQQADGGPGEAVVLLVPGGGDVVLRERSWQDAWLAGLAHRKG